MTMIKGFDQMRRKNDIDPTESFDDYLDHIIRYDQLEDGEKILCMFLDEEGNYICELSEDEADKLIKKLLEVKQEVW